MSLTSPPSNPTESSLLLASELFQLNRRLIDGQLEQGLFLMSLYHVQKMLEQEFGQRFATYFRQHYPKAFYKLVRTTQTRITWRPSKPELTIIN